MDPMGNSGFYWYLYGYLARDLRNVPWMGPWELLIDKPSTGMVYPILVG